MDMGQLPKEKIGYCLDLVREYGGVVMAMVLSDLHMSLCRCYVIFVKLIDIQTGLT